MADRVASIEVYAGLEDRDLIAGLKRAEAEVDKTAEHFRRTKASAELTADYSDLEDAVANARRLVKQLDGEKALVEAGVKPGDLAKLEKQLDSARKSVKALDGERAEIEVKLKGADKVLAQEKALAKAADDHARAIEHRNEVAAKAAEEQAKRIQREGQLEARAHAENERRDAANLAAIQRQGQLESKAHGENLKRIRDQGIMEGRAHAEDIRRTREMILVEQHAHQMNDKWAQAQRKADYDRTVGLARQKSKIVELQRAYARLTDEAERVGKRRAFSTEGREKLRLDASGVRARMEAVKAELNFLGGHPPVEIQVEMDRRRNMSTIRRQFASLGDMGKTLLDKAMNLKDATVRLGPFTTSIKGAVTALGFLGPSLVDVAGAAGSLIGVLGGGILGATGVASAGLVGMGTAFLGLKFATRNTGQEIGQARKSINALQAATLKYGKGSDQAKKKQDELNSVLKQISPLAKESALGIEKFFATWDKRTASTQGSLGRIAKNFFSAFNSMTPMWAKATNELSDTLDKSLAGGFKFFKSPEFKGIFKDITGNFNKSVPTFLHALGSIGHAFLNFAREGSKFLKPFADGVDNLADRFLNFTKSDSFSGKMKEWYDDASKLMHFFGALTRVIVHFFGLGQSAGRGFLTTMTDALNRWDKFLTSANGKNTIADGFSRAVSGAQALWGAIAPIGAAFIAWSSTLSPFITGILKGVGVVTTLLMKVTELANKMGMLGPLGMALGGLWAVSKIGAFVSVLARIPGILRAIAAQRGVMAAVGALGSGKAIGGARAAESAAASAAGDLLGGAAGNALGNRRAEAKAMEGAAHSAEKLAAKSAAATGAGALLGEALVGAGAGAAAAVTGVVALGGAIGYFGTKALMGKSNADKLSESISKAQEATSTYTDKSRAAMGASAQAGTAMRGYKAAVNEVVSIKRQLAKLETDGKKNTSEYRNKVDELAGALDRRAVLEKNVQRTFGAASKAQQAQTKALNEGRKAQDTYKDALKARSHAESVLNQAKAAKDPEAVANATKHLADANRKVAESARLVAAQHLAEAQATQRAQIAGLNYARTLAGFPALAGKAAASLASLSRAPNLQKKIALKYEDPKDAAKVAARAGAALKRGVPSKVAFNVVSNSASAEQAVRRLNAIKIAPKVLNVKENGASKVRATLDLLAGKKISDKQFRAVVNAKDADSKVRALIALGIPAKTARLLVKDDASSKIDAVKAKSIPPKTALIKIRDQASSGLSNIINLINSVHDRSATITTHYKQTGTIPRGMGRSGADGLGPMSAASGASQPNPRLIDRAAKTAALSGKRRTTGGKYNQPTLLVGEENRSEFVIATNPKYRRRNREYLHQAGRALGMDVAPRSAAAGSLGTSDKSGFHPDEYKGTNRKSTKTAPKYSKKFTSHERSANKKRARGGKNLKLQSAGAHPWGARVLFLESQQDVWERELSIRQSQVKEPDDFMMNDPSGAKIPGTDDPMQVVDTSAVDTFKASLNQVQLAFGQLTQIITGLMSAIPNAIREMTNEMQAREFNKSQLKTAINVNKKLSKSKDKKVAERAKGRVEKYQGEYDRQETERKSASSDRTDLKAKLIDSGFDFRENNIASGENQSIIDALDNKAKADVTAANTPPDTSGGGAGDTGSGSSSSSSSEQGISIQQQTALALTQNADTLKQFGQNFINGSNGNAAAQFVAGAVGGAGAGAGQTSQPGIGTIGPRGSDITAAMTSGSRAATYMSQSGAAGGAGVATGADGTAGGNTNVNVVNNFQQPPPDPHTWSQGVAFELGTL
jgi:hypothetical protein